MKNIALIYLITLVIACGDTTSYESNSDSAQMDSTSTNMDLNKLFRFEGDRKNFYDAFKLSQIIDTNNTHTINMRILNNPFNLTSMDTLLVFTKAELFSKSAFTQDIIRFRITRERLNDPFILSVGIFRSSGIYIMNSGENTVTVSESDNCADLIFMPTNEYDQIYFRSFFLPIFDRVSHDF
jgi:hypothetical protein